MPIEYKNTYRKEFSENFKNKIVRLFTDSSKQIVNTAFNPYLLYSTAQRLIKSKLSQSDFLVNNDLEKKRSDDFVFSYDNQGELVNDNGVFNSNLIIDNFTFESKYVNRNFFDNTLNFEEIIEIPVLIGEISFSFNHNYNETTPIGYKGSIKEYIGSSNIDISINGVFFSNYKGESDVDITQNFPDVRDFITMCIRNKQCSIIMPINEEKIGFDLSNCTIKSFSLPSDTSFKNLQRFDISLSTDNIITI